MKREDEIDFSKILLPAYVILVLNAFNDVYPIIFMIFCIKIAAKADWNILVARHLTVPRNEEEEVSFGSHGLVDLCRGDLNSELLES